MSGCDSGPWPAEVWLVGTVLGTLALLAAPVLAMFRRRSGRRPGFVRALLAGVLSVLLFLALAAWNFLVGMGCADSFLLGILNGAAGLVFAAFWRLIP